MPGFFVPGSPLYNEEGGEILKGLRKLDAAKRLLTESGYSGQPVTFLATQDLPNLKAWGDVTADLLNRLGIKTDFVAADWGTVVARRVQKSPPGRGGWHLFHTGTAGVDCADPTNIWLMAMFGWPNIPEAEGEIAPWYDAKSFEEEKAIAHQFNKVALEHVVYAPLGFYLQHQAWRKNVTGIVRGPLPFFWGVSKTV